jgi:hypothetical protein
MSEIQASPNFAKRGPYKRTVGRRDALIGIVASNRPCTVRQVFYQATVAGIVEKSEAGYGEVQRDLVLLRRNGTIPYGSIVDNTRRRLKYLSHDSIQAAIEETARFYRKALWADVDCYVEVWVEKDALSGALFPVTNEYDVPLMPARGYASLSFLASAAEDIRYADKPAFIYHLGDYDPSGVNAGEKIEETLRELAPDVDLTFERLAVNPDQIVSWDLPSRPTKTTDSRAKKFGSAISVELDAIPPQQLRQLVREAIERHMPASQLLVLKAAEESERASLKAFARLRRDR